MKRLIGTLAVAVWFAGMPVRASAHDAYDDSESHPLRLVAYAVHKPVCQLAGGPHIGGSVNIHQVELECGTAAVDDQNLHGVFKYRQDAQRLQVISNIAASIHSRTPPGD